MPHLRRYAWALLGPDAPDHADDLVQTCLQRALERAAQWQPSTRLRPWLFAILHNLYVSGVRRQAREKRVHRERAPLAQQARGQGDGQLEMVALAQALSVIPFEYRAVFVLVSLEGYSYEEAAQALEVPVGTIRSRLARARDRLENRLQIKQKR